MTHSANGVLKLKDLRILDPFTSANNDANISFPDPYDIWTSPHSIDIRARFYRGKLSGKLEAVLLASADWLFPGLMRRWIGCEPNIYPIVISQLILMRANLENPLAALNALKQAAVPDVASYGAAWGLGFPWMSKNGLYGKDIPFVTHTPYAMEALLELRGYSSCTEDAEALLLGTWQFLRSLHVMYDRNDQLALSYAPIDEPRIVVNANAYACYAHALHGEDNPERSVEAFDLAERLARFTVAQQQADGSWFYYADQNPGNFIDCFHTCFVLKNLMKAAKLSNQIGGIVSQAVVRGKKYLDLNFFDTKHHLAKRFTDRDIRDPYVWDIYDQAEYLGVLVEFGELDEAVRLRDEVRRRFFANGHWYCKIDLFGRRWGKEFARWGIVPFLYHEAMLQQRLDSPGKR